MQEAVLSRVIGVPTTSTCTNWTKDKWGNIHFSLVSNGFTAQQWLQHFKEGSLSGWADHVLNQQIEAPSYLDKRYDIVLTDGCGIKRVASKIRQFATLREWSDPHWEVACLIANAFTDNMIKDMGLWRIITMHKPIKDCEGYMRLLSHRRHDAGYKLRTVYEGHYERFEGGDRFAFVK